MNILFSTFLLGEVFWLDTPSLFPLPSVFKTSSKSPNLETTVLNDNISDKEIYQQM